MDEAVDEALLDDVWYDFERDDESDDCSHFSADEETDEETDEAADETLLLDGCGQWNYESYSARGSEYHGDRKGLVRGMNMVSIDYNPANSVLFDKVQRETPVLLERARNALNLSANGKIKALDAFRVALPPTFITMLVQWLSQVLRDSDARFNVTRSDVWGFIMIHIILRATHQTFKRLESGRSSLHQECAIFIQGYRRVRKAMGLDRSSREDRMADGTSPAAYSMSGHLDEMEEAARSHWVRMFFVPSVTWVSFDDDKLPFRSETSEKFGVRLTSTKRRKCQPGVHVVASITTGFIVQTWVESLRRQVHGVIELAVRGLTCNPGDEAIGNVAQSLTVFLDRGYLSIARDQEKDKQTNIVQILQRLGVKFVGTCRRTNSFPFADKDELKAPATQRGQVQVATGGRRTFYVATTRSSDRVGAVFMRHGQGKARVAQLVTNEPTLLRNIHRWAYETRTIAPDQPGKVERLPHATSAMQEDASVPSISNIEKQIAAAIAAVECRIVHLTRQQRTQDWFLQRLFRATSTCALSCLNFASADFLHTQDLIQMHKSVTSIARITSVRAITQTSTSEGASLMNVANVSLPGTKRKSRSSYGDQSNPEFWMREFKSKASLREKLLSLDPNASVPKKNRDIAARIVAALQSHSVAATGHARPNSDEDVANDSDPDESLAEKGPPRGRPRASTSQSMPQADDRTSESGRDWDESLEGTSHEPRARFAASRAMPERDQIIDSDCDSKSSCENMNEADEEARQSQSPSRLFNGNPDSDHVLDFRSSQAQVRAPSRTDRQKLFLQTMLRCWFRMPANVRGSKHENPLAIGTENEDMVLEQLARCVRLFSDGAFSISLVKQFGLVANREVPFAAGSPDGVGVLLHKVDGDFQVHGAFVLEIKTYASSKTIKELDCRVGQYGEFCEISIGTNDFVKLVPKPADRAQVVHHAAVLDVEIVLLVYATPEEVRQVVAITVPLESRQAWRSYLHALSSEYMGFAYVESNAVFPDAGTDHSEVYGYARDHHTVEVYLQLWRSHNKDIQRHGTPPPCSKLLPQIVSFWNHMMGGVDTMRKVLSGHKVIASQLNPNCLLWISFLEYTLYNAFRLYQLSQMEERAAAAQSFDEWSTQRRVVTFNGFLYDLMEDALETTSNLGQKQFCENLASHNIGSTDRDLRQLISTTSESPSASSPSSSTPAPSSSSPSPTNELKYRGTSLPHVLRHRFTLPREHHHESIRGRGKVATRRKCLVCCRICDDARKDGTTPPPHARKPRTTTYWCCKCNAAFCKGCYDLVHRDEDPFIPHSSKAIADALAETSSTREPQDPLDI